MPIGYEKATRLASGDVASRNYFGDDSDGSVTYSSSTNLTVQNKNGSYDGDMLVRNYTNLTINSGVTLTVDQPCRGMLIYVSGDCTINGTLSMTRRGAYRNPTDVTSSGLRLPIFQTGSSETLSSADFAGTGSSAPGAVANQDGISGNGKIYTIAKTGTSGAGGCYGGGGGTSCAASNGSTGQSGGGGGGGGYGGTGGSSTCFSGGAGGGGRYWGDCGCGANSAQDYGGKGGDGCSCYTHNASCGGSAGNPYGNSRGSEGAGYPLPGQNGTGGLLILIVGGDLSGSGTISANGGDGGFGHHTGGGGSGGGNVIVLHAGAYSAGLTVTANGGNGGGTAESRLSGGLSSGGDVSRCGGDGGNGSVQGPTQIR